MSEAPKPPVMLARGEGSVGFSATCSEATWKKVVKDAAVRKRHWSEHVADLLERGKL